MKKILTLILLISFSTLVKSQVTLDYYLPEEINYNSSIPVPKQFFGHEIGEWHLSHDKLYVKAQREKGSQGMF